MRKRHACNKLHAYMFNELDRDSEVYTVLKYLPALSIFVIAENFA